MKLFLHLVLKGDVNIVIVLGDRHHQIDQINPSGVVGRPTTFVNEIKFFLRILWYGKNQIWEDEQIATVSYRDDTKYFKGDINISRRTLSVSTSGHMQQDLKWVLDEVKNINLKLNDFLWILQYFWKIHM